MDENKIPKVKDGKEKSITYRKYMAQYNKAYKYEFYLEAIGICYAMMEDRLVSFLHHLGVVSRNNDKVKINKCWRLMILDLLDLEENGKIRISQISTKIEIVKKLILLSNSEYEFMNDIIIILNRLIREDVLKTLDEIVAWKNKRNQYTHALFAKKYYEIQKNLLIDVTKGYQLARELDKYVKVIKKNNIRRKYKIQ